uniref:TNase-like domain-containing protein n=1 Tax=viral metagenome TaxID=1070528 RepID=A0A6C0E0Z4_9ZZZZ
MYTNENIKNLYKNNGLNTEYFTLKGKSMYGRLVDVLDGDSIKVVISLFDRCYKFNVRLNGIDTSEMKSKRDVNKERAMEAREMVCSLVTGKSNTYVGGLTRKEIQKMLDDNVYILWLECHEFDKYGRLLADVYIDYVDTEAQTNGRKSINEELVKCNLAYRYSGKTKLTEEEQETTL